MKTAWPWLIAALVFLPSTMDAADQIFPVFADGVANGVVYRSSLKIVNPDPASPALNCTLAQRGTSASFVGIAGDRYYADIFGGDNPPATISIALNSFLPWEVLRSTAQTPLKTGYVSLSCTKAVHAELQISLLDLRGGKLGETTVPPASQGRSFEFLIDRSDGTRLGFALTNNSSIEGEYALVARDETGHDVDRAYETIDAWSTVTRFVDEVLVLPAKFIGTIEVVGLSGGSNYVAGLQFSGGVFATIAPIVRSEARQ